MYYKNFDDNITSKYGVILKGWPFKTFQNPSEISSRAELQVLKNSLDSGATYFKRLTASELTEWEETRFQSQLQATGSDASEPSSGDPSPNPMTPAPPTDPSPNPMTPAPTDPSPNPTSLTPASTLLPDDPVTLAPTTTPILSDPESPALPAGAQKRRLPDSDQAPPPKKTLADRTNNKFINLGVTAGDGTAIMIHKKARKQRSDKGKKRGSRSIAQGD